jgi:hypothetical protein
MRLRQWVLAAAAALIVAPTAAFGETIDGDAADAFTAGAITGVQDGNGVNAGDPVGNPGGHTLKIGSVNVNADGGRAPILIFQLPNLGAVIDPFTTASLTVGVGSVDNDVEVNVDLYGLTRLGATPDIDFTGDYYLGPNDTTGATMLQDDFLTPASDHGSNANPVAGTTDVAGSAALLAFLNSQYNSGLGADQYIFLRLNVDGDMLESGVPAVTGYNVTTANDNDSSDPPQPHPLRPKIDYTTSVVTEDADFDGDGDVDGDDFLTWQRHVAMDSGATLAEGDANGDEAVDGDDLTLWEGQFGTAVAVAAPVPEPATAALALVAAAAWSGMGRSKTRKRVDAKRTRI